MSNQETCPHCGAKMRHYKVKMTPMMVRALIKFRQAVNDQDRNSIHLLNDMKGKDYELTRHEWNNFTRQRFLALCAKVEDKPGYWLLTHRGAAFLNGEEAIPAWVIVFRNKIIERSETKVNVAQVIGSTPYLERKEDIEYQAHYPNTASPKPARGS